MKEFLFPRINRTDNYKIIKKNADDTKLGHKVNTKDDRKALQPGLDLLFKWTVDWGMQFNIPNCKVLHVGRNNHSSSII